MKRVKMGAFALAAIFGVGSAFTSVPKTTIGTKYYAVETGSGTFAWQTTDPASRTVTCSVTNDNGACTITSTVTVNTIKNYNSELPSAVGRQTTVVNGDDKVYN